LETTLGSPAVDILVIKNGTLIDGTGNRPRSNSGIVIRGGTIAEVGPGSPFDQAGGATVIDAAGRFILRGLIGGSSGQGARLEARTASVQFLSSCFVQIS
jgi:imidazolonepropionase-like amidohydrolase